MGVLASTIPGWAGLSGTVDNEDGSKTYKYTQFGKTTDLGTKKTATLEGSGVVVTLTGDTDKDTWIIASYNGLVYFGANGTPASGGVITFTAPTGFAITECKWYWYGNCYQHKF